MKSNLLFSVLANTYSLQLKTQNYHWNVVGNDFVALHTLFGKQYEEMYESIDEIAERIRTFGTKVTASFETFAKVDTIGKANEQFSGIEMVKDLKDGNDKLCICIKDAIKVFDDATDDFLRNRLLVHQKNIWVLSSILVK